MAITRPSDGREAQSSRSEGDPALVLSVDGVTKRYGSNTVVDDLTFSVQPGRVTGFLGPNGSGKSTTMKILLGLAAADGGSATIGGQRYRDLVSPLRTVGAALESNAFHPGRSGRNHLRILAAGAGLPDRRVDEALELVGLTDAAGRRAGAYSQGMKQRLGLAGALLGDPPILVLDEPGNGLDPQGVHDLRDLLRARAAAGHTVLVSSHVLGEVELLADDVIVINQGRLIVSGPLAELQETAARVGTSEVERLVACLEPHGASIERRDEHTIIVRGLSLAEIGDRALDAGVPIHELSPGAGSLEELFLGWTDAGRTATDTEVIQP